MAAATPAIVRELRRVLDEASIPDAVAGLHLADETEAPMSRLPHSATGRRCQLRRDLTRAGVATSRIDTAPR